MLREMAGEHESNVYNCIINSAGNQEPKLRNHRQECGYIAIGYLEDSYPFLLTWL